VFDGDWAVEAQNKTEAVPSAAVSENGKVLVGSSSR
jgi:hypothetical protein